jgi:hypothetical protein
MHINISSALLEEHEKASKRKQCTPAALSRTLVEAERLGTETAEGSAPVGRGHEGAGSSKSLRTKRRVRSKI